jgi:hypothetical protein
VAAIFTFRDAGARAAEPEGKGEMKPNPAASGNCAMAALVHAGRPRRACLNSLVRLQHT